MIVLYIATSIVTAFILAIFLRIVAKRILFSFRLKSLCRDKRFNFFSTHRFWCFGWTRRKKCDFLVETSDLIYSVKLIGSWTRRNPFNFIDEEHYSVRNLFFQFSVAAANQIPYDVKSKSRYDFTSFVPKDLANKRICTIILMSPVSGTVTKSSKVALLPVSNGDRVAEGLFYSASSFLKMLVNL